METGIIIPDQKVYKAADLYAKGEFDESREVLTDALGMVAVKAIFNALDTKEAWTEDDDGYASFLNTVNDELGQPIYIVNK